MIRKLKLNYKLLLLNLLISTLYLLVYIYIYENYLFLNFEYLGYMKVECGVFKTITFFIILQLPNLFYRSIVSFSSYFYCFYFYLFYTPVLVSFYYSVSNDIEFLCISLAFLFSSLCFSILDRFHFSKCVSLCKYTLSTSFFKCLSIGIVLLYLLLNWRNVRFVGFEDIYSLRQGIQQLGLLKYLAPWILYCIGPFYLVLGLCKKSFSNLVFGFFCFLLIYSTVWLKSALFMPIIIIGLYLILKKIDLRYFYSLFGALLSFICLLIYCISDLYFMLSAVILMRTISITGLLTFQYYTFFQTNPITFFSHIRIVDKLLNIYPYKQDLGFIVSSFFSLDPTSNSNSNANFIATDGIASIGLIGVYIVTILTSLVLIYINRYSEIYGSLFTNLLFTSAIFTMLNVSLFTTLLTGGVLILIFVLNTTKIKIANNK